MTLATGNIHVITAEENDMQTCNAILVVSVRSTQGEIHSVILYAASERASLIKANEHENLEVHDCTVRRA